MNCLYCAKTIRVGRSDKKFCDSGCKDAYYNAIKEEEHQEIRKIDLMLKKNRRILHKYYNPGKPEMMISRETLLKAGFEFGFHTHIVVTKHQHNEFVFCYNYGYRETGQQQYQVIRGFSQFIVKDGGVHREK